MQQSPNHLNSLRYMVEVSGKENQMGEALKYQNRIVEMKKAEHSPDLFKEYRKLMKLYDTVAIRFRGDS